MANISIKLDKRHKNEKGLYPIKFYLNHKRTSTFISTSISVKEEMFIAESIEKSVKVNCPNSKYINSTLAEIYYKFANALLELEKTGKDALMSVIEIKNYLLNYGKQKNDDSFSNYSKEFMSKIPKQKSRESYEYTLRTLNNYFKGKTIFFEMLNAGTLRNLDDDWSKTMSINTRGIHFRNIRAIFNRAIDDEICSQELYPFRKFKIKTAEKEKEFLPVESFRKLLNLKLSEKDKMLEMARDFFLLSFYFCGINPIDLFNLTEIKNNRIIFVRQKTSGKVITPIKIKIQSEAMALVEKYRGKNRLFNFSEHYLDFDNFYHTTRKRLKKLGTLIEQPDITFYWARYTWASYADKIGIEEKVISKSLGHADISIAGKHYISYDWERTDKANRKVIDYLLNKM